MKSVFQTSKFKKDVKRAQKRGKDLEKLERIVNLLLENHTLPESYRDHALGGNWLGTHDCHLEPDWLLLYRITDQDLFLERTGTHSDLF